MRNAALVLGIIGGLWAMLVGFFGFGYTEFIEANGPIGDLAQQVDNVQLVRAAAFLAPVLAIAGGAMARSVNMLGGALMLAAAGLLWLGFGFNVFTMFPIAMCALGGMLSLAARQPDAH
ncbi:hypothetical protein FAZ78_03760 [Cereibacter changlensis]|jgi:hypothetical protein|uniref:DUF4064 domain-containing protein n=2 Tax=Cereibacter changlensis TaxID=402884 RepID=A0A2T4JPS7_9RHOB|nr:hypothetical protein [Cereibacter changlensis]PTE19803.1 hypothetical protein C5F48_20950 [Cereibacter changlensis JA139]PZX51594.1 hypothetical protein LX76_02944 [Cereibacter changlensis]TKA97891.1 hypothetical protein FAZ78_03760 [Cereibacter changlensis]